MRERGRETETVANGEAAAAVAAAATSAFIMATTTAPATQRGQSEYNKSCVGSWQGRWLNFQMTNRKTNC